MKKIFRIFFISLFSFLTISLVNVKDANAAWNDNAYDFYKTHGQGNALYIDGAYWFCSRGEKLVSSLSYRTIGYEVSVRMNGTKYSFSTNIGGYIEQVGDRKIVGDYNYVLYKMPYDVFTSRLTQLYPDADLSELVNRNVRSIIYFDAYVTFADNGVPRGSMDRNGKYTGEVYHDVNKKPASWIGSSDWRALFFSKYINAHDKKVPYATVTPISVFTVSNYSNFYGSGQTYFTKPENQITLQFKSSTNYYDKYNRIGQNFFLLRDYYGGHHGTIRETIKHNSDYEENVQWDTEAVGTIVNRWGIQQRLDSNQVLTKLNFYYESDGQYQTFYPLTRMNFKDSDIYFSEAGYWIDANKITIISDGKAPVASSSSEDYDISKDKLDLYVAGVTDVGNGVVPGSGVKSNSVYAVIYPNEDPRNTTVVPMSGSNNYRGSYTFTTSNSNYGDYTVEYWGRDNVNNEGIMYTSKFTRIPPKPVTTSVLIQEYEYEDTTTKWVKADNEFKIHQSGYSLYGNPTESHIRISKSVTDYNNSYYANAYSMRADGQYAWNTNTPHLVKNRNTVLQFDTRREESEKRYYGTANYYFLPKAELNGEKFYVFGTTELVIKGNKYTGDWIRDPKMLGIDGMAPIINYTSGGGKANVTIQDMESGFNRAEVTIGGHKTTYNTPEFSVTSDGTITITAYDNVGNHRTITIEGTNGWEGKYIQTKIEEINGKKVLKYRVNAQINDFWYDKDGRPHRRDHSLMFTAESNLYIKPAIIQNTVNYISYSNLVEDKFNVSYGPKLRYDHNNSTYAFIRWEHIEDLVDQVDLKLYKDGSPWDSVRKMFASGRKNYKWDLYQTKDRYGNAITKKKVNGGTITGTEVDMSTYKTGSYEFEVTMYDYNGNPSGKSVLKFDHVQPHVNTDISDLFLKVTAVKDLNWESMNYPIKYNALEFPLGKKKLSKNGEGIKLGYVVNFSIENLIRHKLSSYSATYSLLGENGEILTGESRGSNFKDLDRRENTGYLSQNNTHITLSDDPKTDPINNGYKSRLFFKHFLPADAEFRTTDGRPYRGKVTVRMKINLQEVGSDGVLGNKDYIVDLYTIDTSGTAYDDLYIDKQR